MSTDYFNQLNRLISCIEQAESSLKEYESVKNATVDSIYANVAAQLRCHERYVPECLIRLKSIKRDLAKARSQLIEYDDFVTGRAIPVIYGPPEVMDNSSQDR